MEPKGKSPFVDAGHDTCLVDALPGDDGGPCYSRDVGRSSNPGAHDAAVNCQTDNVGVLVQCSVPGVVDHDGTVEVL